MAPWSSTADSDEVRLGRGKESLWDANTGRISEHGEMALVRVVEMEWVSQPSRVNETNGCARGLLRASW